MSDIHVGYRGGRFADNFDSVFRKPKASFCRNCIHFYDEWCNLNDRFVAPEYWCGAFNPKTRSV